MATIQAIYRYPIKGLSPEPLSRTTLAPGQTVPGDRLYAIENGPSGFDAVTNPYLHKQHFLMLMRNERLAKLRTTFDHGNHTLTIEPGPFLSSKFDGARGSSEPVPPFSNGMKVMGNLRTVEGRGVIEQFFTEFCADELRGPPRILHAPGHSFSDMAKKVVSIINLASVGAIEEMIDASVNPVRFRGNVYVNGWPAWSELDLLGKTLTIGRSVKLKVVKRILRCAATNVDPDTGIRDLEVPKAIMRHCGHGDCGIYGEVIEGGEITAGDTLDII